MAHHGGRNTLGRHYYILSALRLHFPKGQMGSAHVETYGEGMTLLSLYPTLKNGWDPPHPICAFWNDTLHFITGSPLMLQGREVGSWRTSRPARRSWSCSAHCESSVYFASLPSHESQHLPTGHRNSDLASKPIRTTVPQVGWFLQTIT